MEGLPARQQAVLELFLRPHDLIQALVQLIDDVVNMASSQLHPLEQAHNFFLALLKLPLKGHFCLGCEAPTQKGRLDLFIGFVQLLDLLQHTNRPEFLNILFFLGDLFFHFSQDILKTAVFTLKPLLELHDFFYTDRRFHNGVEDFPLPHFDPFGDFDLLFGAARLNLKIVDVPIRYRERTYGMTQISRFRHGLLLLRMCWFALRRIKFV